MTSWLAWLAAALLDLLIDEPRALSFGIRAALRRGLRRFFFGGDFVYLLSLKYRRAELRVERAAFVQMVDALLPVGTRSGERIKSPLGCR